MTEPVELKIVRQTRKGLDIVDAWCSDPVSRVFRIRLSDGQIFDVPEDMKPRWIEKGLFEMPLHFHEKVSELENEIALTNLAMKMNFGERIVSWVNDLRTPKIVEITLMGPAGQSRHNVPVEFTPESIGYGSGGPIFGIANEKFRKYFDLARSQVKVERNYTEPGKVVPTKKGYHQGCIPKGKTGEFSKVEEEFLEAQDAIVQKNPVMLLLELADMLGAIERFLQKYHPTVTLDDVVKQARLTNEVFASGGREDRDPK